MSVIIIRKMTLAGGLHGFERK